MIEAHDYAEVCKTLAGRFQTAYGNKLVNITGLIFASPASHFARQEVIPFIDYWHHRSDNVTDFFCAGFGSGNGTAPKDKQGVKSTSRPQWWFSNEYFTKFISEIEGMSDWKFSNETDIIIVNARFDSGTKTASLDFTTAITLNLERAKQDQAISSVNNLLGEIFTFAQRINEGAYSNVNDPVNKFADSAVLRQGLWSWLEKFLQTLGLQRPLHFVAKDISLKRLKKSSPNKKRGSLPDKKGL